MFEYDEAPHDAHSRPADLQLDTLDWVRAKLGLAPDERQADVLRANTRRAILNCCRQWGKSTVIAAKAVELSVRNPGSLTLVVGPGERQSSEFVRKAETFTARLGIRPRGDGFNATSLAYPNGSRMVGLPASEATIRGFSAVSLLVIDEASKVSDDLYLALRPMLAVSNGALWIMSTPWGRHGFFYDTWTRGGDHWLRIKATGPECPRIRAEFLAEERIVMGDRIFRREYLCEFDDLQAAVFDSELIARAVTTDVKPLVLPPFNPQGRLL
jgi:hypothetical protein